MFHKLLSKLVFTALILSLAATGTAFADPIKATAPDAVTVAIGQNSPPYYFVDDQGKPAGWLVDLWRLWSEKTGIKVSFIPASVAESLELVRDGKADVLGGGHFSKKRAEYLDFVANLASSATCTFIQKDIYGVTSVEDLLGFRIGVLKGTYAESWLEKHLPEANLALFPTNKQLAEALKKKRLRVFVKDVAIGLYMLVQNGLDGQFRHDPQKPLFERVWKAAVRKGNTVLPELIKAGMDDISEQEQTEIKRRWVGSGSVKTEGVLTISCDRNFPPFTMLNNSGRPIGMLVDLWRLWAKKTGQKVEFLLNDWDQSVRAVEDGRADFHAGLIKSPSRADWMAFSMSIYPVGAQIFYSEKKGPITLEQLVGQRVGVIAGWFEEEYLKTLHPAVKGNLSKGSKSPIIEVVPYKSYEDQLEDLADGRIRAILDTAVSTAAEIHKMGLSGEIDWVRKPVYVRNLRAGLLKGRKELLSLINLGLSEIYPQEIMALEKRWIPNSSQRLYAEYSKNLNLSELEKDRLAKHKTIRMAVVSSFPPYVYFERDGSIQGVLKDYIALINKKLGVEIEPVRFNNLAEAAQALRSKEIDGTMGMVPTFDASKQFNLTRPYLWVDNVIVTRTDAPFLSGPGDLAGKVVTTREGFALLGQLKKDHPNIRLMPVSTFEEGLVAVDKGEAFAFVGSLISMRYTTRLLGLTNLKVAATTPYRNALQMAIRKDWDEFEDLLDRALQSVTPRQREKIIDRWANVHIEKIMDWKRVWRISALVASVIGLVLAVIMVWNRRLSREVSERKKAEATVRASQNQLQEIVDTVPSAIWVMDADTRYLLVNAYFEESLGDSRENIIGKTDLEILAPGEGEKHQLLSQKVLESQEPITTESELTHADGTAHTYLLHQVPLVDEEQALYGLVGLAIDITQRKEMEKELSGLSKVFADAADPIIIEDSNGLVIDMNPEAERLYGWDRDQLLGLPIKTIVPPERHSQADDLLRQCKAGKTVRGVEGLRMHKDGTIIPVLITLSLLKDEDGEIIGIASIAKDIGAQKKTEQALAEAKKRAEDATQAKSDFLANMSHEIRTPMNAIMGMSHLALKTDLTPKQRDYITKVDLSARSLLGIINDILDFSKIEAGKMDMESVPFSLEEVLENVSNLVGIRAQKKNLELLFKIDPRMPSQLLGDPLRLGQVLNNLASNAVKFTEEGHLLIAVKVTEVKEDTVHLQFRVTDTGIGLTEEQQGKLFKAFSQADTSTTRKYGGTGLGLTISKRLIEMLGGEIRVESVYGEGASFIFTAAFGLGESEEKPIHKLDKALKGIRTLVVDDNAASREILRDMLEVMSFRVSLAASGEEGIEEVAKADADGQPFDLVLMDWKMPGMDGIKASEKIKTHPGLSKIPAIIMVTAYGREEVMQTAEKLKLEGFLLKPATSSTLLDAILLALGREAAVAKGAVSATGDANGIVSEIRDAYLLLVEDNEINRQVAVEILTGAGFRVTVAEDGKQALDAVRAEKPDGVLMDIQMPVMDGYEATREIRKDPAFKDLPIIAMTASAMVHDREEALAAGMNDFVSKPIDVKALFQVLARYVKSGGKGKPLVAETVSKKKQPLLPELDGIDTPTGIKRLGGNTALYRKLLVKFAENHKHSVEEISEAVKAGNVTEAERRVHKVKGVAGNIAAIELFEAATKLDDALKLEALDQIEALLGEFSLAFDRVMTSLESLIPDEKVLKESDKAGPEQKPSLDLEAVLNRLEKTVPLLREGDLDSAESLEEVSGLLKDTLFLKKTEEARAFLEQYDFEGALKTVNELSQSLQKIREETEGENRQTAAKDSDR